MKNTTHKRTQCSQSIIDSGQIQLQYTYQLQQGDKTHHTTTHHKFTLTLNHPSLQNKTTDVVIHQHSRKLLKMDILMSETCSAHNKWKKKNSEWHQVGLSFVNYQTTSHEVINGIDCIMASPRWLPAQSPSALTLFPCVCVCNSKYCDENNGAGTNNWIRVKNSHSHNIRRKNTQQLNNLITLSYRFAVVDDLYVSRDKATSNIPKVHKALRAQIDKNT